uniref:Uncharacterized protein n=1 Tax=Thermus thermophilus (strain ATCC 27634 / DSM 579 / HB8) TaxID=300852 RepID=G9MBA0_THET8|nr:hypothetical protein [Thermus thermophilus HB8]
MPSVYPAGRPGQSAGSGWFLLVGRKRLSRSGLTRRMGVKPPVTTPIFDPLDFGHGLATPREGRGPLALGPRPLLRSPGHLLPAPGGLGPRGPILGAPPEPGSSLGPTPAATSAGVLGKVANPFSRRKGRAGQGAR